MTVVGAVLAMNMGMLNQVNLTCCEKQRSNTGKELLEGFHLERHRIKLHAMQKLAGCGTQTERVYVRSSLRPKDVFLPPSWTPQVLLSARNICLAVPHSAVGVVGKVTSLHGAVEHMQDRPASGDTGSTGSSAMPACRGASARRWPLCIC